MRIARGTPMRGVTLPITFRQTEAVAEGLHGKTCKCMTEVTDESPLI
jgi:hypothetical protein